MMDAARRVKNVATRGRVGHQVRMGDQPSVRGVAFKEVQGSRSVGSSSCVGSVGINLHGNVFEGSSNVSGELDSTEQSYPCAGWGYGLCAG